MLPLDPARGSEGPRALAVIDEAWCIGCTLCIKACPVDCIVGASKLMHTVIDALCTGCELCVPACPVDCIAHGAGHRRRAPAGQAWSPAQADEARERYAFHRWRIERDQRENDERLAAKAAGQAGRPGQPQHDHRPRGAGAKRAVIEAARQRARARRAAPTPPRDSTDADEA